MRSVESKPNLIAVGGVIALVSAIASVWGVTYAGNSANRAFADLPGNQDSTYQIAQICAYLGVLGCLAGLVMLLIGLRRNR